jgi:hypothetical protein
MLALNTIVYIDNTPSIRPDRRHQEGYEAWTKSCISHTVTARVSECRELFHADTWPS